MSNNTRFLEAEIRQQLIDALRTDLIGPMDENEKLDASPIFEYLTGMLYPKKLSEDSEKQILSDFDMPHKGETDEETNDINAMFTNGNSDYCVDSADEDDNEPNTPSKFQQQSSIGMSFYLLKTTKYINVHVSWGDYDKVTDVEEDDDGNQVKKHFYSRRPMEDNIQIDLSSFAKQKIFYLGIDSHIYINVMKFGLGNDYNLITVNLTNNRQIDEYPEASVIFQVNFTVTTCNDNEYFIAESKCRSKEPDNDVYYKYKPVFGRGRGCAVDWKVYDQERATSISTSFIPEYEIPSVKASIDGLDPKQFLAGFMMKSSNKDATIEKLMSLKKAYDNWIENNVVKNPLMKDIAYKQKYGDTVVKNCKIASQRIGNGINLLRDNPIVFDAFCFMNTTMVIQKAISGYANKHGNGFACNFTEFQRKAIKEFCWRPFQIAFILMNIESIINPLSEERNIVDLLYFPTGGGKTEAYLGLMAFTIANRRLKTNEESEYNYDGGVTIILRYTLRLLTTQQRDRLLKMIIAAEMVRKKFLPKYGLEPITLGFWVGSGVTPNNFDFLMNKDKNPDDYKSNMNLIKKQVLTCPFCGERLDDEHTNCFIEDSEKKSIEIYCKNKDCMFNIYKDDRIAIPLYLVDEAIYSHCPTILLSTVDKFAVLPWKVQSKAIFGKVDRKCSRDGYVAEGVSHSVHNATIENPKSTLDRIKPFAPPELIVQDELHLITGPLGTIYGAYETIIQEMCKYKINGKVILPKYVVSTATIKNADEQVKCLYARTQTSQFPPNGLEIGDSFFIKEIPIKENPFRKYVGISVSGQSMKTTVLRTYAILLEKVKAMCSEVKYKDYLDPYYTLVGYFNSIRELGGTVRLLQDDIPKRIWRIKRKYNLKDTRYTSKVIEITSRIPSYSITKSLKELETSIREKGCADVALATNMIAVGMDVDRLGLMCVQGQPKQNSEYIQATSRIGRQHPGLVVTVYNPYRPRDLSFYENFKGYHEQFYRYVEGTTATPFSARARDRVLHALIITAIRFKYPEFGENKGADLINNLTQTQQEDITNLILNRLAIVNPKAMIDTKEEIEMFIDNWKRLVKYNPQKTLYYTQPVLNDKKMRLMVSYDQYSNNNENSTLNSMREVEKASTLYYEED